MSKFSLGDEAKNFMTGFKGVIVAKSQYLHSNETVCIQPPVDEDGKWRDCKWFDVDSVEITT